RTETIAHPVHKTLQRFPLPPAAFKALLCRQPRIDSETGKRDRFNAETGIEIIADGFKLLAEEARNMVRLMRGKARARAKLRHLPVRAEKLKLHPPRALALLFKHRAKLLRQMKKRLRNMHLPCHPFRKGKARPERHVRL